MTLVITHCRPKTRNKAKQKKIISIIKIEIKLKNSRMKKPAQKNEHPYFKV
uniref:Uncharacterized protein n=1 Tax=Lepeophtheirus salmonis TaxID=72036 RepID=A0A0K2V7R5_LEPSM